MKVILLEDDVKLGNRGDTVRVRRGYAVNYLIPQKKALLATRGNTSMMNNVLQLQQKKIAKERGVYEKQAEKLKEAKLEFTAKAGLTGHLYGTITSEMIVEQILEKTGIEISKKKIALNTHIKAEGHYPVKIKLFSGVDVVIPITVHIEKPEEDTKDDKRKTRK